MNFDSKEHSEEKQFDAAKSNIYLPTESKLEITKLRKRIDL